MVVLWYLRFAGKFAHRAPNLRAGSRIVIEKDIPMRRIFLLDQRSPWIACRSLADTPRLRLFCLPHAGGGASEFHPWTGSLPASVQVCPILLPGRETRFSESLLTNFDELTETIVEEMKPHLDLPYAVFGHSMGALLAFECVRRLEQAGAPAAQWLFLSGRRAPDAQPDAHPLHALPDAEFLDQLHRIYKGIPEELLSNPEIMQIFLPILRADIAIVESYRFADHEPLDCPITVFAGQSDTTVTWQQLMAWKRHTRRQFAAHIFPGDHFYPRGPLLQVISTTLGKLGLE